MPGLYPGEKTGFDTCTSISLAQRICFPYNPTFQMPYSSLSARYLWLFDNAEQRYLATEKADTLDSLGLSKPASIHPSNTLRGQLEISVQVWNRGSSSQCALLTPQVTRGRYLKPASTDIEIQSPRGELARRNHRIEA